MSQEFTDKTQREIEAYILHTMSEDEAISFEARINSDKLLKQEVLLQRSIHQAFDKEDWSRYDNSDKAEIKELTAKLSEAEYKNASQNITKVADAYFDGIENKSPQKNRFSIYQKIAIAASLLFLISLPFFLFNNSLAPKYESLAQWDDVPSVVEKGSNTDSIIVGEQLFRAKEYKQLVNYYTSSTSLSPNSLIQLGISYLELDETENALLTFNQLIDTKSLESSRAYWYKLLAYVKEDNKEKVKETLDTILSSEDNYNYKKALNLSKEWKTILED